MIAMTFEIVAVLTVASACTLTVVRSHRRGWRKDLARRVALMELAEERLACPATALPGCPR